MAVKFTDRTLVITLFIVLAVLCGAVLVGNRQASDAAKDAVVAATEARDAAKLVAVNLANTPACQPQ